jgi:hypothetical protein
MRAGGFARIPDNTSYYVNWTMVTDHVRRITRRQALKLASAGSAALTIACTTGLHQAIAKNPSAGTADDDRTYWVSILRRLAEPVLGNLALRRLKATMPVEIPPHSQVNRRPFTHLEALGRLLCGIAPWLEVQGLTGQEKAQQDHIADLARRAIDAATDPHSPDYMNFSGRQGDQPIVDAAFLAHATLRAPRALWRELPIHVQQNLIAALQKTLQINIHKRKSRQNNWLLFPAMIEAALYQFGVNWDPQRVALALERFQQWYLGDGAYGDGPKFRWDYYNSLVIQPMLIDILHVLGNEREAWRAMQETVLARAQRYAVVLERMISPEGTLPPIGRSLTYRFGALQLLGQMALLRMLPASLHPAQVRCAMTAVLHRMMDAPGTFDPQGWLRIGLAGHQPSLGERYISTGSLYLCAAGLLPLGLPPDDPFWAGPSMDWTARRIWAGQDMPPDSAMRLE